MIFINQRVWWDTTKLRRKNRYCHHEQPCWCGKPRDHKFEYEHNFMGATNEEIGSSFSDYPEAFR